MIDFYCFLRMSRFQSDYKMYMSGGVFWNCSQNFSWQTEKRTFLKRFYLSLNLVSLQQVIQSSLSPFEELFST